MAGSSRKQEADTDTDTAARKRPAAIPVCCMLLRVQTQAKLLADPIPSQGVTLTETVCTYIVFFHLLLPGT